MQTLEAHPGCNKERRLPSNSASPARNEIDSVSSKGAPVRMQNANQSLLEELIQNLNLLLSEMVELETSGLIGAAEVHPDHRASARNLLDYLALRRHDIRPLQAKLARLGLSSLGRTEPHVLSSLHAVLKVLHQLAGSDLITPASRAAPQLGQGTTLLEKNTDALLGEVPAARHVRIMVTMPPEAATKYELVRDLLVQGMDCMRINCAHDGPEAWSGMIRNLRRAEAETNKHCKVAMDLAGPKLRTGSIEPGPTVLKYRPKWDNFGRVVSPARIWLTPTSSPEVAPEPTDAAVPVPQSWLARIKLRDRVRFIDTRGASRAVVITGVNGASRWADAVGTAYIFQGMMLETRRPASNGKSKGIQRAPVGPIPAKQIGIILKIETREGFDHLPQLLLAVMRSRAAGVMIARGDLAVECGYQRLAEVQEEILWVCEAAHMPVIWATQVLESLAKNGIPSRAVITDAAMGERAECVMLNKGPYILTAVRILGDILQRMQPHHEKKNSMLRKLRLAVAFHAGA